MYNAAIILTKGYYLTSTELVASDWRAQAELSKCHFLEIRQFGEVFRMASLRQTFADVCLMHARKRGLAICCTTSKEPVACADEDYFVYAYTLHHVVCVFVHIRLRLRLRAPTYLSSRSTLTIWARACHLGVRLGVRLAFWRLAPRRASDIYFRCMCGI